MLVLAIVAGAIAFQRDQAATDAESDMRAVAASMQVPADWTLTDETITTSGWLGICAYSVQECPSMQRNYTLEALPDSSDAIVALLPDAEWSIDSDDCRPPENVSGVVGVCAGTTVVDGFDVSVTITADAELGGEVSGAGAVVLIAPHD